MLRLPLAVRGLWHYPAPVPAATFYHHHRFIHVARFGVAIDYPANLIVGILPGVVEHIKQLAHIVIRFHLYMFL